MTVYGERLVRVEEQINELRETVGKLTENVNKLDEKIDKLLILRYKGAGAFWLMATLVGTGMIGLLSQFLHYIGIQFKWG